MGFTDEQTLHDRRSSAPGAPRGGRLRRGLFIAAGFICVGLGLVGIVVPLLPTAPFIILAAYCFARSSERWHRWLVSNRLFGKHLQGYLEGRGVAWKVRIPVLLLLWVVIGLTAFLVFEHVAVRAGLLVIAAAVTAHVALLRRPTSGAGGGSDA
jgi:uncharacterized protein